jgi:hypothetical protein
MRPKVPIPFNRLHKQMGEPDVHSLRHFPNSKKLRGVRQRQNMFQV